MFQPKNSRGWSLLTGKLTKWAAASRIPHFVFAASPTQLTLIIGSREEGGNDGCAEELREHVGFMVSAVGTGPMGLASACNRQGGRYGEKLGSNGDGAGFGQPGEARPPQTGIVRKRCRAAQYGGTGRNGWGRCPEACG